MPEAFTEGTTYHMKDVQVEFKEAVVREPGGHKRGAESWDGGRGAGLAGL